MKLKICNGQIITPYRIIAGGTILIDGNKITAVSGGNIDAEDAINIDAGENYIAPGFIDIHIHGGGGYSFMDATAEAFLKIAETHARFGTTSLSPTTLSCSKEDLMAVLDCYEEANKINDKGAQFIGMHLEGPYLAVSQCGAQDTRYIRDPDPKEYMEILSRSNAICRWSIAPELKGAMELGRELRSRRILAAIAHTDAIYEEALEAFESGYSLATHFYSAMSGVTRRKAFRYAGVIESCYLIDEMDVEIIADGVHLPAPLLKLICKVKGAGNIALITDAMRAAGTAASESVLGSLKNGLKVIVEDGVAKLPDRSGFAGSVATTDRLVRTMVNMADVSLIDAVRMMTVTPARIMGISGQKGAIAAGKDADLVIFDKNINIEKTIVNGKVVYSKTTSEPPGC
ncbi:MAG: N-acetylglucosamine-6-phosphate deacetylase [Agriterribacter sp.]